MSLSVKKGRYDKEARIRKTQCAFHTSKRDCSQRRVGPRSTSQLTFLCLVWVRSFSLVLQHLAGASIHADLKRLALALDVERIAKAGASTLFLELLISDLTGTRGKCRGACLRKCDFRQRQEIRTGKVARFGSKRASRAQRDSGSE